MALFIDGKLNGLQDLHRYESGLFDVTSTEQIDLSAKTILAKDLIAAELLSFLLTESSRDRRDYLFCFEPSSRRRVRGVTDVVITEPLKRWHALRTIELAYGDAYFNQLNDRYEKKRIQYQQLAQAAGRQLFEIGVGLVSDPVSESGPPLVMSVAGALMSATYYARIAWVNREGQEGAAGGAVSLTTVDGAQLLVSAPPAPANVVAWNAYVGLAPESATLQNPAPIAAGTDWTLPVTGLRLGRTPGTGQKPDRYVVNERVMLRG